MGAVTTLDYFMMVLYLAGMLYIGWWTSKLQKTAEDYLVSGRKMGFWANFATHLATQIGAGSTVGVAGVGFTMGIAGMGYNVFMAVAYVIFVLFVVAKIYKLKLVTIGDILHLRFNKAARIIAGIVVFLSYLAFTSSQFAATGKIIKAVWGWNLNSAIVLGALVILFYTYAGGLWAVAITDFVQWVIMIVGIVFIAFPLALSRVGGWSGLKQALPTSYFVFSTYGPVQLVGLAVSVILGFLVTQDVYQRVFAAKDEKTASAAMVAAAFLFTVFAFVGSVIGMCAKVLYPSLAPEEALPHLIAVLLPPGLTGLVLAGYIAAIMSTADSCLHAGASSLAVDIFDKGIGTGLSSDALLRIARYSVVGIAAIALVVAISLPQVYKLMLYAYTFLSCGLATPVLAALFWRRATGTAAVASMLAGGIAGVLWQLLVKSDVPLEIVGAAVALLVVVVVSYLTPPPSEEQVRAIYRE